MRLFATEFPIQPISGRAAFVAQVLAWLRGITSSHVLENVSEADLDGKSAHLRCDEGEELRFREFDRGGGVEAIGFRHDLPDQHGRLWRTEAVLQHRAFGGDQGLLRVRSQCLAHALGARLEYPRKPYLIKATLQDRWGGIDGLIDVSDKAVWLSDDEDSLALARAAVLGKASDFLPIVYVSVSGASRWVPNKDQIEKLAYDLGGVAHVVVEPSRDFSFRLREETDGSNVYGGTIGLAIPEAGIARRFFLGWHWQNAEAMLAAIRSTALAVRSYMPARGWDWAALQEEALREQRRRERNRLSDAENVALYEEEIANLREQISDLKEQNASHSKAEVAKQLDENLNTQNLIPDVGPEIYSGEIMDRVRLALEIALASGDQIGLDSRSKAVFEALIGKLTLSLGCKQFREDLKRSIKDPKRLASEVTRLLKQHGYQQKSDKKHVRLVPDKSLLGLETVTVSKTPSDHRAQENLRRQIEHALGMTKLTD